MWFQIKNQEVSISIYAKPNAKRSALLKIDENGLHISLHAKPQEGEANKELISFLSDFFEVPKSFIRIKRGENTRIKIVELPLTEKVNEFLNNLKK